MKKRLFNKINKELLKQQLLESTEKRTTLSFYQYAHIVDPNAFRNELYEHWVKIGVCGRVYVAKEGINAQLSLPEKKLNGFSRVLGYL